MTFLSPERLLLGALVVAIAIGYVVQQRRRKQYAVRFTNLALIDRVMPRQPGWRRHVPPAALLLALVSLVTAFAQPARFVNVPRERATVVMAIDVSLSMEATDVAPSRLAAAKEAAASFVDLLPSRLNLGLVSFSGVAQVLVAPTTDHALVKRSIDTLSLGPRTAVGEAVFLALATIQSVPVLAGEEPAPGRIVLMSDGETTVGRDNETAAQAALEAEVPVYTIAFGTDDGAVAVEGRLVPVPVNREALRRLADATGGTNFEAATARELRRVYADIGSSIGFTREPRDISATFAGIGLAFALAAAAASLVWFSRLP